MWKPCFDAWTNPVKAGIRFGRNIDRKSLQWLLNFMKREANPWSAAQNRDS